ncbi:helix-turn-helix domain-containing protein [Aureisphaera galaxeae]|uniref:helix-turn-helix domain-containing protein n=1 Tax=Aureisphaera galaxeae TaxID=1538023 RepID=UPI00234FE4BC|nr:helix-turn-helix domain-containing protein [Aureisphaera galaxeae]MDC8003228.1 helix-turn-helix domain-containing protein [Aureisphaera galaxeae]
METAPSLDTWTSGFLLAVALGIFLFTLLISSRNKKNLPIAFLILAFSVILFQYVLFWTRYEETFPYLVLLPPLCYYVTGPLLYLYLLRLYKKEVSFNYALHFLPAAIALIPNVVLWMKYLGLTESRIVFLKLIQQHWFIAAHMLIYTFLFFRLVYKNTDKSSELSKVRNRWTRILASLYFVFVLAYISYYVLVRFPFFSSEWDYMISVTMSLGIYTIGYFIFMQPQIFNGELYSQLFLPIKNKNESFEASLMSELFEKLTQHMEQEKPFIDNELRLVHLADQLGFSTHLLSKVINKKAGKNFNQFVNEYRLLEAQRLLSEGDASSIKSIYFDVGFNNKATFYNAFKKKFNCTPTQYRNAQTEGLKT